LASEQEPAPVPSFLYLGTTPTMLGTSSKILKVKIEPHLAIHCGCPKRSLGSAFTSWPSSSMLSPLMMAPLLADNHCANWLVAGWTPSYKDSATSLIYPSGRWGCAWPPGAAAPLSTMSVPYCHQRGKNQLLLLLWASEKKLLTWRK
jgi:hypothetical protein